jgi:hypothetical protein
MGHRIRKGEGRGYMSFVEEGQELQERGLYE